MLLNCLIDCDEILSLPFSVEVCGPETFYSLQEKIKKKYKQQLKKLDALDLLLWKIEVPSKEYRTCHDNFKQLDKRRMLPIDEICEIFAEEPRKKHIHILVEISQKCTNR
ncbi:uncharacterized protein VTP21DRAFT_7754 [Calcarisporiella thermophila]|uniref:uncharacterized protein n=1 Tax=Calcarisporiella thermophila TaxID=911321 RepID=UPI003743EC4D